MPEPAITFDFHNTIASADQWFHIEVFDLLGAYLRWRADRDGEIADPAFIETANAAYRQLRHSIHHHGHEPTAEQSVALVLRQFGIEESAAMIETGTEAIMQASLGDIAPVPGVLETIRDLSDAGIPLGIVSIAIYSPFLTWVLDRFGITDRFGSITTSARSGFYKNRPEIYWSALEEIGGDPRRSLHIGDSFRFDVLGARRAGMSVVWYQRTGAEPLPGNPPPDLTLETLEGAGPLLLDQFLATQTRRANRAY